MNKKKNTTGTRLPDGMSSFLKDWKHYWKKHKTEYSEKKDARLDYLDDKVDTLPEILIWYARNYRNRSEDVMEVKDGVYSILADPKLIKHLIGLMEGKTPPEGKYLLPVIYGDILGILHERNNEITASGEKTELNDTSGMEKLIKVICKKPIKKLVKKGVPEALAADIAAIIPNNEILENTNLIKPRIYMLLNVLYEHAKEETIPVDTIFEKVLGENYYSALISVGLLERKEKFGRLVGKQSEFYLAYGNWICQTLESMKPFEIEKILNHYASIRFNDSKAGKDANRRYALTSLSSDETPKVQKVVAKMIANNPSLEKVFS